MKTAKLERLRPFFVHPAHAPPHQGHQVPAAANAEDAALQYIELWTPEVHEGDLRLIVEECGTGHESCLTVHLATGEAEPCGD